MLVDRLAGTVESLDRQPYNVRRMGFKVSDDELSNGFTSVSYSAHLSFFVNDWSVYCQPKWQVLSTASDDLAQNVNCLFFVNESLLRVKLAVQSNLYSTGRVT